MSRLDLAREKVKFMNTTGKVYSTNPPRGRIAIKTTDGFTIVEVTKEGDFRVGDDVRWLNGTDVGAQTYHNVTRGTDVQVTVQNHWVPSGHLREQMLLE
jgi:hypothetical protein